MMWVGILGFGVLVALAYATWRLVIQPNTVTTKDNTVKSATLRGRTLLIDKLNFGIGEVMQGQRLTEGRVQFLVKDSDGVVHTQVYYETELEPSDVFSAICGQNSPVYIVKRGFVTEEGDEWMQRFIKSESKRREATTEVKRAHTEIDERVEDRAREIKDAVSSIHRTPRGDK